MIGLIYNSLYIFFIVLEMILLIYILSSWLPLNPKIKGLFVILLGPILDPIRFLLDHSIFKTRNIDLAPIIAFIIISFFQNLFRGVI